MESLLGSTAVLSFAAGVAVASAAAALARLLRARARGAHRDVRKTTLDDLKLTALEAADNPAFITDFEGRIVWANRAFERRSGYPLTEVIGGTPRILRSGEHDESFYRNLWQRIVEGRVWRGEIVERARDGSTYVVQQTITPIAGVDGPPRYFVAMQEDVTARTLAEQSLHRAANYDGLTGLPNRALLLDRIRQAIEVSSRVGSGLAVMLFDLDRFKEVNDTLGHAVGDRLLVAVARRVEDVLRPNDTAARLGGDEFAVLVPDVNEETAAAVATRLVGAFSEPLEVDPHQLHLTISLGVALCPQDGGDPSVLLHNADLAMYRAKSDGRDRYAFFAVELDERAQRRKRVEAGLRKALASGELSLAFQPQCTPDGRRLVGIEALLRWRTAEAETIAPADFVPVAEHSGDIVAIGRWVIEESCRRLAGWRAQGVDIGRISVNISSTELRQSGLAAHIAACLQRHGLPPGSIAVELSEATLLEQGYDAGERLAELHAIGAEVHIDDFGTGYSSLARMRTWPIDVLKIDRSFVQDLEKEATAETIIGAVVALGHQLGLVVLAEGVETPDQAARLAELGCDGIQGFLIAPGLSPDALPGFVSGLHGQQDAVEGPESP